HRDVSRRKSGVAHQRLVPCAIPVRPEARLDVDGETGYTDDAPKHRDSANFFSTGKWLGDYFTASSYEPAIPNPGEHAQRDQFAPEQCAVIERELAARRVQPGRECELVVPEP